MLTTAFVDPIAFTLGPLTVRWYGLIIVSAIMLAIWLVSKAAKRRGLDPEFVPDLAMIIVPSGILGARLYEVFVLQWDYYRDHPGEILKVWEGGLAIHGGVILAVFCGFLYVRYRKQPFWTWADMVAPALILAQGIGRWGNFFNQEAYGSAAPQSLVDQMPDWLREGMTIGGVVHHPTFLYESVWNIISFGILFAFERKSPAPGKVFSLYLILYNAGRMIIESIRMDSSYVFGIRTAQLVSILLLLLGVALYAYHARRNQSQLSAE